MAQVDQRVAIGAEEHIRIQPGLQRTQAAHQQRLLTLEPHARVIAVHHDPADVGQRHEPAALPIAQEDLGIKPERCRRGRRLDQGCRARSQARAHAIQCAGQPRGLHRLDHVVQCIGVERAHRVLVVRRAEDNKRRMVDTLQHVKAGAGRHLDVEQHAVRSQMVDGVDGRTDIIGFTDDVHVRVGGQQRAHLHAGQSRVVHQQGADARDHWAISMVARTWSLDCSSEKALRASVASCARR